MTSPVIAEKEITIAAWLHHECPACHGHFDIEREEFRMAPGAPLVVSPKEAPFALIDSDGHYTCPHCDKRLQDQAAAIKASLRGWASAKEEGCGHTIGASGLA